MHPEPSSMFWSGRRVLVTGHTGFKGTWLARWLARLGADVSGYALDPELSPAAAAKALPQLSHDFRGDIRDRDRLSAAVESSRPDVVFHLAAQALVREGYRDPTSTFDVNAIGTSALLESLGQSDDQPIVVVITSDKVYANDGSGRPFPESAPLGGLDPYSLSKVFAEQIVAEWRRRHPELVAVTARAGNVIGGGDQGQDRIMVDVVDALVHDRPVVLRNPASLRPWQHVLDAVRGYLLFAEHAATSLVADHAINFGPDPRQRVPVSDLVEMAFEAWGSGRWMVDADPNPPEASMLILDPTRAAELLAWRSALPLADAVDLTCRWHLDVHAGQSADTVMDEQLDHYIARLR